MIIATLAIWALPTASLAQAAGSCLSKSTPDASIAACTSFLQERFDEWKKTSAIALTARGLAFKQKGELDHAAADFSEAIRLDPKLGPAREARAVLYSDAGKCDAAEADFAEAIRLQPDQTRNYLGRGLCAVDLNRYDQALSDVNEVIRRDPANSEGYTTLALSTKAKLEAEAGKVDAALISEEAAIKLSPDSALLYVERGSLWSRKGEQAKALSDFEQALKIDHDATKLVSIAAWSGQARVHAQTSDLDRAITDYSEALKLSPNSARLLVNRAALRSQKGDTEHALIDYAEAIKAEPKGALAYNSRGDFFRDQGQYDRAIADYDKAVENQPGNMTAIGSRALTQFFRGDFGKAAQDFAKVFDTEPNSYTLLWLYISRGQADTPRQARAEIAKLSTKLSGDEWPAPLVQLALGKKTSADAILSSATTPEQKCEAQFYIGEWQLLQKDRSEAIKALQAAADTCPKDATESIAAREELKRLKTAAR